LRGYTWEQYLSIEQVFEGTGTRVRFWRGQLEIRPPVSEHHENRKSHLARLIEAFFLERDIEFYAKGNYTLLKPQEAGGEPDECYCLRENKEWPDLVVEVALTSGGFSKRSFCATFPIPELWIWRNDSLEVHDFDPATAAYHSLPESRQLPGIDLNWLVECSRIEATSQGIKTFRSRL
jgi:Uma2 family endonuclease